MSATDDHSLSLLITCFMNYDLILEAAAAYCKHETLRVRKKPKTSINSIQINSRSLAEAKGINKQRKFNIN